MSLRIKPIGEGNYSKLNTTINNNNVKNVWSVNLNQLLKETMNNVKKQKESTGFIETEFLPLKNQRSINWAKKNYIRTPNAPKLINNTVNNKTANNKTANNKTKNNKNKNNKTRNNKTPNNKNKLNKARK
jgi:hypothetical protein